MDPRVVETRKVLAKIAKAAQEQDSIELKSIGWIKVVSQNNSTWHVNLTTTHSRKNVVSLRIEHDSSSNSPPSISVTNCTTKQLNKLIIDNPIIRDPSNGSVNVSYLVDYDYFSGTGHTIPKLLRKLKCLLDDRNPYLLGIGNARGVYSRLCYSIKSDEYSRKRVNISMPQYYLDGSLKNEYIDAAKIMINKDDFLDIPQMYKVMLECQRLSLNPILFDQINKSIWLDTTKLFDKVKQYKIICPTFKHWKIIIITDKNVICQAELFAQTFKFNNEKKEYKDTYKENMAIQIENAIKKRNGSYNKDYEYIYPRLLLNIESNIANNDENNKYPYVKCNINWITFVVSMMMDEQAYIKYNQYSNNCQQWIERICQRCSINVSKTPIMSDNSYLTQIIRYWSTSNSGNSNNNDSSIRSMNNGEEKKEQRERETQDAIARFENDEKDKQQDKHNDYSLNKNKKEKQDDGYNVKEKFVHYWTCTVCTFAENPISSAICTVCGKLPPDPKNSQSVNHYHKANDNPFDDEEPTETKLSPNCRVM